MPTAQAATTSASEQERLEEIFLQLLLKLNAEDRFRVNWRSRGEADIRGISRAPEGGITIHVSF